MAPKIERIDTIPLIIASLEKMNVQKTVIERVTGWSVGEKDATAFNVYHDPENNKNGVLAFGHSKDHRPDLLQFKQGLATLDPAGVPILSETQECIL